jgi:hypothetical protein
MRRSTCLLSVLLFLGARAAAAAEPEQEDLARARTLNAQGEAAEARDDFDEALARFRAAQKLYPSPVTNVNLARMLARTGVLIEARELLRDAIQMPAISDNAKKQRELAATMELELVERIPKLRIALSGPTANTKVDLDGRPVPLEAVAAPLLVNPGKHVVVVTRGTKTTTAEVELAERETREVHIEAPAPDETPAIAPLHTPDAPATSHAGRTERTVAIAAGGASVVAAGLGAFFGLRAKSIYDDAGCLGTACDANGLARTSHARDAATTSTVAFVGAGVLLSTAVVLWLVAPDERAVARAARLRVTW